MKYTYLKSLVLVSVVFGLNFEAEAQSSKESIKIRNRYGLVKLQKQ